MHPADRVDAEGVVAQSVIGAVFDMGGVLTINPYETSVAYAVELGIPEQTFSDHLHGPLFGEVEVGTRSVRDFFKDVCTDVQDRFGTPVDIARLAAAFAAAQQVRPEMIELVSELADRGAKVGMLTNNTKEARSWWTSGVLPLKSFTAVVDSSEVGMRKPDPEIFALTASRMGCQPGELLFFDDIEVNVAGAVASGMLAHLFITPEQCRQICESHGLLGDRS